MSSPLTCPVCLSPLDSRAAELRCQSPSCGRIFPLIGDIPCLAPDPQAWLTHWLQQLELLERSGRLEAELLGSEMKSATLQRTRDRLARLLTAKQKQRAAIELVLSQLTKLKKKSLPLNLELSSNPQPSQTLLYHYANILRDWAWESDENRLSAEAVLSALGSPPLLGECAVLGAGACRLATDLAQADPRARVHALDLNPLLILAAKRVLDGAPLELPEFPLAPRSLETAAPVHACRIDSPPASRPQLLIADVLLPPLRPGSLDTVVAPWIVDVLPVDAAVFLARVNSLLKPGGRWVHFGPLGFTSARASQNYSPEEFEDLTRASGFEVRSSLWTDVPYLRTPSSGQQRLERVLTLVGVKVSDASPPARRSHAPAWLGDPKLPIPASPQLTASADSLHRALETLSLVDGKRSLDDIADVLATHYRLDRDSVRAQVKNLLAGFL